MEYTKEQLKEKFEKLPADIKKVLLTDDIGVKAQLIGRDIGITPEQSLDTEDEAIAVLMGTSHPKDFIRNIQSKIGVDQEKAKAIAEKVNDEIFQPVRESLKVVHNIKDEEAPAVPSAPKPPTPPVPGSSTVPEVRPSVFPEIIVPRPGGAAPMTPPPPFVPPKAPETPKPPQNIFEQKLQGVFKMPKEETLVPPKSSPPQPPQPPRPGGVDPYREQPK